MRLQFLLGACLLALGVSTLASCDGAIDSAYNEQITVGAFLYANEPLDSIVLHRTTPFGSYYDDLTYAVEGADVYVTVDGVEHKLLPAARKGRYYLPASELTIEGGKTYELRIDAPNIQTGGMHHLRASTIVPMPIHFTNGSDSLRGQLIVIDTNRLIDFQYTLTAGPIDDPNRKYLLGVTPLDTLAGKIRPLPGPPVDTLASTRYSFLQTAPRIGLSPRLFGYFGANRIQFVAVDTNWVDYQRQIVNPNTNYQPSLNHVEGGLGVFGSGARDTMTIWIKLKE